MAEVDSELVTIAARLRDEVAQLSFAPPVAWTYNPLDYAWASHREYLRRYGPGRAGRTVFLGMNPGPWGMAQTGVPFGDVPTVRDWLRIDAVVGRPPREHPRRPVDGLACRRVEVSGNRLWSWVRSRFGEPERFFTHALILNYCPLMFMEESGRNRTPDRLPQGEAAPLFAACDRALWDTVTTLDAGLVIGIGAFAVKRARNVLADSGVPCAQILHPSPASPAANQGWAETVERQLAAIGFTLPARRSGTESL